MKEIKYENSYKFLLEYLADLVIGLDIDKQGFVRKIQGLLSKTDSISLSDLKNLISETASIYVTYNWDYSILASRVLIRSLHEELKPFSDTVKILYKNGLVSKGFYEDVQFQKKDIDDLIDLKKDYQMSLFSYKTLSKGYLIKLNGKIFESPQYMYMRVAIVLGNRNIDCIRAIYKCLSDGYISFGTPTFFNAGARRQQLSSCFLIAMVEDSLSGIYSTLSKTAQISKYAGGIAVHIHNIRSKGTPIKGTNGVSNGIIPMLKVFNESSKYVDQGGGKRKGSIAVYIEPWHKDIEHFLYMRKPTRTEDLRCMDLFTSLWIPDLFMKRVERDEKWTLFCPSDAPKLSELYGSDFDKEYERLEEGLNINKVVIQARHLMMKIIESQVETGTPYMLYKDSCNKKSNQNNVGVIKSSNLCAEIIEYSDFENTAVCNLGSIALPKFVNQKKFDFDSFMSKVEELTEYLNFIIDINYYPIEDAKKSNMKMRPIGIGVQGLADVFFKLSLPFTSEEARELNKKIFSRLYYSALSASCKLAEKYGPYERFEGSLASKGILQYDLWGVVPDIDFSDLKQRIKKYGLRNSLLVALMPTASTAQILGNTESFEPQTSNLYKRQTLSGEYIVVNRYLINDLKKLGLWNHKLLNELILYKGSVQNLDIPENLKQIYKTIWEIKQKDIIDMASDRGPYICHSQSMNLWFENPNVPKIYSAHMYAWKKGLKTGSYYVRIRPARDPVQMTVESSEKYVKIDEEDCIACHS